MDINSYDKKTRDLINTMLDQKKNMSDNVLDTTEKLMAVAEESGDDALKGFAHFHMADALYAFESDYNQFRSHLGKAINCLQNADDKEMLARTFNYIGVDAMNNGSFDVGYFYFMNAFTTCQDMDNNYLKSMMNNNIGQIYARMGNHAKAIEYVREGNRLQALCDRSDVYFYQNMINGYFSEGVLCVALGDYDGALEMKHKIEELDKESGNPDIASVYIPVAFLRIQIAVLGEDEEEYEKQIKEVVKLVNDAHRLYDFITDIDDLCRFLLERDRTEPVRMILDSVKDIVDTAGVIQLMKIISSIEIAYYEHVGDEEMMMAQLKKQHELAEAQQREQHRLYQYSIDIINTMDQLRKEKDQMHKENQDLQLQAMTDGLTGIPNRLAFDNEIRKIYGKLAEGGKSFGINMMDIDKFKEYNDTYGHQAGDDCLRKVASVMAEIAKKPGVWCGRFGGDEFVMLFEDKSDEEALEVAYEMEDKVHALGITHRGAGESGIVSVSQGICNGIPASNAKFEDFLAEADTALYAVKKNLSHRGKHQSTRLVHLPESR